MKKIYIYGDREKRLNYVEALEDCGAQAVVSTDVRDAESCDALLLPGGADMDPNFYGEDNLGSNGIDRSLDLTELALVNAFHSRPILGICRGMQVLNVAFGGTLVQDLPTAAVHRWQECDQVHIVSAPKDSFLYRLYGERFSVNSAHHQGVARLGDGFSIAAIAHDGGIEAIQWPEKRIYAVQWHPERLTLRHKRADAVDGKDVFQFFLGNI
ncbi:MAG: gamma-glutamyl-gamma-aminobutyrate hydrolase family protein [Acutalibacter sp.]|uniref:gamma-glutamyl-gamma-aminobutyrate hydrolase family protein n=1 Tax=Acutalibacter sp. TaxID=1918636 RepID=UPI00216F5C04|nr:gamma-glutamyl-gamma-aminobutyrate hydrolase family protein [Acutalibacter sp.]MCI9226281.1 gamma-glutamyl-gamma-aminobutyrate hydrolase family protein [Acutalibacter sp.]